MEPDLFLLMMIACASVTSSITSENRICGLSWSFLVRSQPVEDRLACLGHVAEILAVHLEHPELPLDEQDAGLEQYDESGTRRVLLTMWTEPPSGNPLVRPELSTTVSSSTWGRLEPLRFMGAARGKRPFPEIR